MTNKEALKIISYDILQDEKPVFSKEEHIAAYQQIEKAVEKLELLKKQINGILNEINNPNCSMMINGGSIYDWPLLRDTLLGFKKELEEK